MASYGGGLYKRERPMDDPNNGYDMPPQKRMPGGYGGGVTPLSQARPYGGYAGEAGFEGPGGYGRSGPPQQRSPPPREYQREPPMRGQQQSMDDMASNVLLFTVQNPKYPITVDVMHTICSADNRRVNRIIIFRKNGVQAMIEFESVEDAERAKDSLSGADIYSGCCTLKIDWAKPARLAVTRNDTDSWDYTNPNLGKEPPKSAPLLPNPPKFGAGPPPMGDSYGGRPDYSEPDLPPMGRRGGPVPLMREGGDFGYDQRGFRGHPDPEPFDPYRRGGPPPDRYPPPIPSLVPRERMLSQDSYRNDPYGPPPLMGGYQRGQALPLRAGAPPPMRGPGPVPGGRGPGGERGGYRGGAPPPPTLAEQYRGEGGAPGPVPQEPGSVLMVYGLPEERVNCSRLFNIFCLYGNVIRIRFLKSKDGAAVVMAQLADTASCERAINGLNGAILFGGKLTLNPSKQAYILDVQNPSNLPDGTPSFMDFTANRNNRFTTAEAAAKNRVMAASKSLYFFNAPSTLTEDDVVKIFLGVHTKPPSKIKIFPSRNEKSCTGLLEWEHKADCMDALALANHCTLRSPAGKNPFVVKFSFSSSLRDQAA